MRPSKKTESRPNDFRPSLRATEHPGFKEQDSAGQKRRGLVPRKRRKCNLNKLYTRSGNFSAESFRPFAWRAADYERGLLSHQKSFLIGGTNDFAGSPPSAPASFRNFH
ncbi:hypothetical protein TNCV_1033261 [Trichonephila clavipes]|nr:hypothetical protein TNCV_1033261 [Trichonephila clavipes]